MRILINALTILAAAGIGLIVGFAWRGKPGSQTTPSNPQMSVPMPISTFRSNSMQRSGGIKFVRGHDDSPLATQLAHDLSMSTGVTRWLYWLEAMEKAELSDFPRLARLAHGNPVAARLLAARWVELDPRHLFDTLVATRDGRGFPANELTSVLFAEWPKRDPEAVIAALSGTNYFASCESWRMNIAGSLIETDPERGLRLMSEWRIDHYRPRMSGVAKWAAADPRHAAEVALANPAGAASQAAMETIGKEWAKRGPTSALDFAAGKTGQLGSMLSAAVLKNWAGRNLTEAAEWLAGTDASTRNRLSPAFVESWAKYDPSGALAWCEANLTGSSLSQAVGGLSKGAAESDVVSAAGFVAELKPSPARAEAAAAVAQKWFPDSHSGKPVPPEAIEWITSLDAQSVIRVLDQIGWRWSESDPKSMAAFLASSSGGPIGEHVFSALAPKLARRDPVAALEWASRLPEAKDLSAGRAAFTEWRRSQPASAMEWLNSLPSQDPRREPFLRTSIQAIVIDERGSEQLAVLPENERAIARRVIANLHLTPDHRAKLLDALNEP